MAEPEYKRPFEQIDFRGYFRWSIALSKMIRAHLYHACHEDELEEILEAEELLLRSKWSLDLPQHGLWSVNGVWTGLNKFNSGNYYGPCLIKFPIEKLNGKSFMAFRREGTDRNRYFFVQYESKIPIYNFGKITWRRITPRPYFNKDEKWLRLKPGAIYDIVLTQPMSLDGASISGVKHDYCISGKCNGCSIQKSNSMVLRCAENNWIKLMEDCPEYNTFFNRFHLRNGQTMDLFDPEELDI